MTGSDFSNPAILWGDDNNMDSKPDSTQRKILLLGSGSVHRASVSEGNQIQQGLGRDEVEKKNRQKQKKKKRNTQNTGNKAGTLSTETKDELATDR